MNGLELAFIYRSSTREDGVPFALCSNLCSSNGFNFVTLPCYLACSFGCQPFALCSHCLWVDSNNTTSVGKLIKKGLKPAKLLKAKQKIVHATSKSEAKEKLPEEQTRGCFIYFCTILIQTFSPGFVLTFTIISTAVG